MNEITIRPPTARDLPALATMVQGLADHHGDSADLTTRTLARDLLGPAPWLRVLIATRGPESLGYAALCPLAQLQFGVRGMDLHHLFVCLNARGLGVGKALVAACKELSRELDCAYLTVGTHPENREAQLFYGALGFADLPPPGPRFRVRL